MPIEENKTPSVSSIKLKIDLHSHTTASDGELTPTELVQRANTMQVQVLAITDHDTVSGLAEAQQHIADKGYPIHLVSGIEFSSRWQNRGIHIVGLNVDIGDERFLHAIAKQKRVRLKRAVTIGEKLERTGFVGIFEQAKKIANGGEITRAHFAKALVLHQGIASFDVAFKRFLGKGKVGNVKAQWPELKETIQIIQRAGGQSVLAHPLKYDMTTKWLRRLIAAFAEAKGDAVEVAGPGVGGQNQLTLHEIVSNAGLKGSVGSDFHGPGRWTELGRFQRILPSVVPVWHDWPLSTVAYSVRPA